MASFLALYRGSTIASAELVSASADPQLVADFATRLLHDHQGREPADPVLAAKDGGRRRALRLIRAEATLDVGERHHPADCPETR
jgi:hypothetical protein